MNYCIIYAPGDTEFDLHYDYLNSAFRDRALGNPRHDIDGNRWWFNYTYSPHGMGSEASTIAINRPSPLVCITNDEYGIESLKKSDLCYGGTIQIPSYKGRLIAFPDNKLPWMDMELSPIPILMNE